MEYNYGHNDSNKVYVNGKPVPMTAEQQQAFSDQAFINDVMIRAFMYMFIAVLLTAVVAMYTATSGLYILVFSNPALLILVIVAEFAFIIAGNRMAARNSDVRHHGSHRRSHEKEPCKLGKLPHDGTHWTDPGDGR